MAENPREQQNSLLSDTMDMMKEVMRYAPLSKMGVTSKQYQAQLNKNPDLWLKAIRQQFPYVRFITGKDRKLSITELKDLYARLCVHVQASTLAKFARFDAQSITPESIEELKARHKNAEPSHLLDEKKKDPARAGYLPIIREFEYPGLVYMPPVDLFMLVAQNPGIFLDSLVLEQDGGLVPKFDDTTSKRIVSLSDFVPNHFGLAPEKDGDYRNLYAHIVLANIVTIQKHPLLNQLKHDEMPIFMDLACRLGRADVVTLLIAQGCPPNGNYLGQKFIQTACQFAHKAIVQCLVSTISTQDRKQFFDSVLIQKGLVWDVMASLVDDSIGGYLQPLRLASNRHAFSKQILSGNHAFIEAFWEALADSPTKDINVLKEKITYLFGAVCREPGMTIQQLQMAWLYFKQYMMPVKWPLNKALYTHLINQYRQDLSDPAVMEWIVQVASATSDISTENSFSRALSVTDHSGARLWVMLKLEVEGVWNLPWKLQDLHTLVSSISDTMPNKKGLLAELIIKLLRRHDPDKSDAWLMDFPENFITKTLDAIAAGNLAYTGIAANLLWMQQTPFSNLAWPNTEKCMESGRARKPTKLYELFLAAQRTGPADEKECAMLIYYMLKERCSEKTVQEMLAAGPQPFQAHTDVLAFLQQLDEKTSTINDGILSELEAITQLGMILFCEDSSFRHRFTEYQLQGWGKKCYVTRVSSSERSVFRKAIDTIIDALADERSREQDVAALFYNMLCTYAGYKPDSAVPGFFNRLREGRINHHGALAYEILKERGNKAFQTMQELRDFFLELEAKAEAQHLELYQNPEGELYTIKRLCMHFSMHYRKNIAAAENNENDGERPKMNL